MRDHRGEHSEDYECINHSAAAFCCPSCCPQADRECCVCGEAEGVGVLVRNLAGGLTHAGCLAPIDCGHPKEEVNIVGECPTCNSVAENVCENGDHPAPAGQRFCSKKCQDEDSGNPERGA